MAGNDCVRFCRRCRQNVFNLSAMTQEEALDMIRLKEGHLCVRFFRRADGTVLTRDCSELRMIKFQRKVRAALGALLAYSILFAAWVDGRSESVGDSRQPGLLKRLYDRLFPPAPPTGGFVVGKLCPPPTSAVPSPGNDKTVD
jgi:hypothetical protein